MAMSARSWPSGWMPQQVERLRAGYMAYLHKREGSSRRAGLRWHLADSEKRSSQGRKGTPYDCVLKPAKPRAQTRGKVFIMQPILSKKYDGLRATPWFLLLRR